MSNKESEDGDASIWAHLDGCSSSDLTAAAAWGLPLASGASPSAVPVPAKFIVGGKQVGAGTVITYNGGVYVSTAAVRTMTGAELTWDAATATLSSGKAVPVPGTTTDLDQLPGQPYYSNSSAICWQHAQDNKGSAMQGQDGSYCSPAMSHRPSMAGQHYTHNIVVLVTADGSKKADVHNTATLDYDLGGKYRTLSGTVGLVDSPFNRDAMEVQIEGDGRVLGSAPVPQAALPASFKVNVAGVHQLSIVVSNVSGTAPGWNMLPIQFSPGAVMIADPVLSGQ